MTEASRRISISPVSGVSYPLPGDSDDRERISHFLEANVGRPVVVVQGLGFVGAVMSLVCANALGAEYAVIGVDLPTPQSYWRIASINEGVFPLSAEDPKIPEFYAAARKKGNFIATHDPYAYSVADFIVVDVNLDVDKYSDSDGRLEHFGVDMSGFRRAIEVIGQNCREDALILIETTVPPGTTQRVAAPIIREELQKRGLRTDHIRLGHSYERVMPGPEYVDSIRTFPRVYSAIDEASAQATEQFLKTIIDTDRCPLTRLGTTNATEMAKVLENSYRAMNISFVVEWSRFAEEAGVDLYAVVDAIRQRPTHANLMYPGIGVGGYCLTKDPLLASWSRQHLFGSKEGLDGGERAVALNDRMPVFAAAFLREQYGSLSGQKILLLGVSYRGEVGDTRFSPVDRFYDCLASQGAELLLHDPYVGFWQEKGRVVGCELIDALNHEPHIVVISTGHRLYASDSLIEALLSKKRMFVFDTVGLLSAHQIAALGEKHTVKVLGRGDL